LIGSQRFRLLHRRVRMVSDFVINTSGRLASWEIANVRIVRCGESE
jgi:hypothetical protein